MIKIKTRLFNTAKKVIKYITFEADTEYDEFYNFHFNNNKDKDIQVGLGNGIRGGIHFNCTCKFHSCRDMHMTRFCSYVLAVILYRMTKVKK